ncbi:PqqD family peptide modification chaperone [Mesorhizobium sp. INR15]|nr:PqqD family peptide modification chaperone [Mesorhizobium sp. INR15]
MAQSDNQAIYLVRADAVSCELAGGLALLDLRSNIYYSLNGVGAFVWELMQQPRSVSFLRQEILKKYAVQQDRCDADLAALLSKLSDAGLVVCSHAENH